jgi:hypothetical protein
MSLEMIRQPGFAVIALYTAWIYAQMVLIIVLLGSLTSKYYLLQSPLVGLSVSFVATGALIAVPFQKANIFSRGRYHSAASNAATMDRKMTWTSHLVRRAVFCAVLPLTGIAYTISSAGPPTPVEVPIFFAMAIGNLSGLAISECNGLIMENFDCSDLEPGMTGRPRGAGAKSCKRTNYSSFPRVSAGLAVCHSLGYIFAAGATGIGGMAQRNLGQRAATGVVASILFLLTLLLLGVLVRFKDVQIIPSSRTMEMEKWTAARRESIRRRSTAGIPAVVPQEDLWRPIIIGNPSSRMRRVCVLELGSMTRWTEIRKKNRLIDENAHVNREAIESAVDAVEEATGIGARTTDLVRKVSQRSSRRRYHSGSPGQEDKEEDGSTASDATGQDDSRSGNKGSGTILPYHGQTPGAGSGFQERECVMGQTVLEEDEESMDDDIIGSDEEAGRYGRQMEKEHGSHMMSKVTPAAGHQRPPQ